MGWDVVLIASHIVLVIFPIHTICTHTVAYYYHSLAYNVIDNRTRKGYRCSSFDLPTHAALSLLYSQQERACVID